MYVEIRKTVLVPVLFGLRGFLALIKGFLLKKPVPIKANWPGIKSDIYLRIPSSDSEVFNQVFRNKEYAFAVKQAPAFIVDAGANVGFASVYLANQFPNARILSIEPEQTNFDLLQKNVAPYPNVIPFLGALWGENKAVNVLDVGLGNCTFRVAPAGEEKSDEQRMAQTVEAITIEDIRQRYNVDRISVLKIDIEGGELDVFQKSAPWIDKVDTIIAELHERYLVGCNRAFYEATNGFDHEWAQGELMYVTRNDGDLSLPSRAATIPA